MLSWRGAVDGSAGGDGFLIMLLLDDGRIAPGASSETVLDQQLMQLSECRHRHARRADLHAGAGDRVEHPRRHHRDHAGPHFDVDEPTGNTLLAVMPPDATPMERMPAIGTTTSCPTWAE
ncbi:MAG TPA: hypothetical protein VML96_03120 [Egibacteraceae bacterium]|nr:hypothetical protein [Egibacteraceae bacterium]